jgi:hypothetical protein
MFTLAVLLLAQSPRRQDNRSRWGCGQVEWNTTMQSVVGGRS